MSITTLLGYFFGSRKAIQQIATTPGVLWLGLMFVVSAGFAREYDGVDLLAEPWYLLLPLAMSLALSLALYCLVMTMAGWKRTGPGSFLSDYLVMLRLFWMTAPLAWLYALPVEGFLSAGDATRANLWMLGIVSTWRVALMVRVVSVLMNGSLISAALPLLLFADSIALLALWFAPLPVVSFMGGIRLTEGENLIQGTAFLVGFFGTISWLIWLIGTCIVSATHRLKHHFPVIADLPVGGISRGLWLVASCSLIVWVVVLPYTQPKQQLRRSVEQSLQVGEISAALAVMTRHDRADFPPYWDPPPRIGYGEKVPPLLDVLEALCQIDAPAWVQELFYDKLARQLHDYAYFNFMHQLDVDELDRILVVLAQRPEGMAIVRNAPRSFEEALRREDLSPVQRERIQDLLEATGR